MTYNENLAFADKPIKVKDIEEHDDGSATLQVECDPETFGAIFNVGFVTLIKAGLHREIKPMSDAEKNASKEREEANKAAKSN